MKKNAPRRYFKKLTRAFLVVLLIAVIIDLLWFGLKFPLGHSIYTVETLPHTNSAALVLGAGVKSNGEPTQVLEDRLQVALRLYQEKKITWILVSGDNRERNYNEPQAMRRWLVKNGVAPECVVCDYAGRNTYASLLRAKEIWDQSNMVVVTSDFHLPRSLYLAKHFDLDVKGVSSSTKHRGIIRWQWRLREYYSSHKAVWNAWFPPKKVILGPKEPIPVCK